MIRRLPVGAEPQPQGGVSFRIWAPKAEHLSLILDHRLKSPFDLQPEADGYWSVYIPQARPGDRYQFRLNRQGAAYPDPASRFQPEGPHAASCVVDPTSYPWQDAGWQGVKRRSQVLYEMHIGTFTQEGTYQMAAAQLPHLAALGVTLVELMPIGEFDGDFGWGYDVVGFFAPYHVYGTPDALKAFIDEAHAHGMGVILDVIYNHIGPSGAYHGIYSDGYCSARYSSDWGEAINFDGADAGPVRAFFIANARYWIEEFHLDGLRFDATHFINDASPVHILCELVDAARTAAGDRQLYMIGENESQQSKATDAIEQGGYGLDAVWNDDFHHASRVNMHGKREAYFHDYRGTPQELVSLIKWGYLYQGQYYAWQKHLRGTPVLQKSPDQFIHYLQNHDQVANSGFGKRLHQRVNPGLHRAMTALLLLSPQTPLLFQGQEFGASSPFLFFADHAADMAASVEIGRIAFLSQFPSLNTTLSQAYFFRPEKRSTFLQCKLDFSEREQHADIYQLHRDLLALRHSESVFTGPASVDGAVIAESALLLRFFAHPPETDKLLLLNLGQDTWLESVAEPLIAPPPGHTWAMVWSSEHPRYGGDGVRDITLTGSFVISATSALVFAAIPHPKER